MKVLIGCEESQEVCKAFRRKGHDAYSCDLQDCSGGHPEWHIKDDVMNVIPTEMWDLIIIHPDCTAMAVSGNRWYGKGMPMNDKRNNQVKWTLSLWELAKKHSKRVALENPVSVIFTHLPNVQYIQPWQFGHGETKKTGIALHNLPELMPTDIVEGREQRIWKMPPSKDRKKLRSKTYSGIANAIAEQWGCL